MADVTEKMLSFFCPTWRTVLKTFVGDYSGLSKGRPRKKFSRSCLHETETKSVLVDLKNT